MNSGRRASKRRSLRGLLLAPLAGLLACAAVSAPQTDPALDWDAPWVQVHVDHVLPSGIDTFEGARRQWLMRLRADGGSRADGRPLFFSGDSPDGRMYLTFYPFAAWSDLDRRTQAKQRVEARLGAGALADYDGGDAALVPPHHSEIWMRLADGDLVPAAGPRSLVDARFLRLEIRTRPLGKDADALDAVWSAIRSAVGGRRACRMFWSLFGRGELVLAWPAVERAAAEAEPLSAELAARLDRVAPPRLVQVVERRDDLSTVTLP